jgi:hypothetical protein
MIKIIVIIILAIVYSYANKSKNIENFNLNCINDDKYDNDFFDKKSILESHLNYINTNKTHKFIYSSESLIPHNYIDNLDNNIIYNLNYKKSNRIMKNEKKIYGAIQPFNSRVLTKNFNNNLDTFYLNHETPVKYKSDCKGYELFDKNICSLSSDDIKLMGKYDTGKLNIYWNLPDDCLDIKKLLLFFKIIGTDSYETINIEYSDKSYTKKYKNKGKLVSYFNQHRINYNFSFKYPYKYSAFVYIKFTNDLDVYSNIFEL